MEAPLAPALPTRGPQWLDPCSTAERLGISVEAVELARDAELVDLHIDTFIPPRLYGYDPLVRHRAALFGRFFFGHLDVHRMYDGGLTGAMWSITTNPFRSPGARWRNFQRDLARLRVLVQRSQGSLGIARSAAEYRAVRATGAHAVLVSIQGANCLEAAPDGAHSLDDTVVRATLVHLTNSVYGATNSPHHHVRRSKGLSAPGAALIRQLNAKRIFVDLAHIHEAAFWDAVAVHDPSQPLLATHAGVDGVRPHWRNLTDRQLGAIADTGGTVGIIFSTAFLKRRGGPQDAGMVLEHLQHIIDVVGDSHASIGSDYDGAIVPPPDLAGGQYPLLVQRMMDAGWDEGRIRRVLGGNALRCLEQLRPETT